MTRCPAIRPSTATATSTDSSASAGFAPGALQTFDASHHAFACDLGDLGWHRKVEAPSDSGGDHRLGNGVLRGLVERGGQAQDVVLAKFAMGVDRDDPGASVGKRARLVEDQCTDPCHRLQRSRSLHQDAEVRRAREPRDEGDRHRQDERTGRGDNQHRNRPDRISGKPPGRDRNADGDGEKAQRPTVRQP